MESDGKLIAQVDGHVDSHVSGLSDPPPSNGEQSGDYGVGLHGPRDGPYDDPDDPPPPTSNKLSLATGVIKTALNGLFTIAVFLPMMLVLPVAGGKRKTKKLNK
jgi:hypothetical protein